MAGGYQIDLFWDAACTNPVFNFDWGTIFVGDSKSQPTTYCKNQSTYQLILRKIISSNINPPEFDPYVGMYWDYAKKIIRPGEVLPLTFTLKVASDTVIPSGCGSPCPFTFDFYVEDIWFTDLNADGNVDIFDAITLAASFQTSRGEPRYYTPCDIDSNGRIDIFDAVRLAACHGLHGYSYLGSARSRSPIGKLPTPLPVQSSGGIGH